VKPINSIQEFISQIKVSFKGDDLINKFRNEKLPLRTRFLLSSTQMDEFAKKLAKGHQVILGKTSEKLLKRLAENEQLLLEVHNLLTESAKDNERISPAAEWLLDNFYLIEEQIYTGKKHLPKNYSVGLPQLEKGNLKGLPRVYEIAVSILSHSDGRVDLQSLSDFISAYQQISVLKLGELWAIPIMLRLAIIENLRRLAVQIAIDRINKNQADYWADQMIETAEKDSKNLVLVIAEMAKDGPALTSSFVAELARRLQGVGSYVAFGLSWIEQQLSEQGLTTNELIYQENQKQAADQVSISNSIAGLRFLGTTDWKSFVESMSKVESILKMEPLYSLMDFSTRDTYRHVIEKIAKKHFLSEEEVAAAAIDLSHQSFSKKGHSNYAAHVGYYLIGKGVDELNSKLGIQIGAAEKIRQVISHHALFFYILSTLILSFPFAWLIFLLPSQVPMAGWMNAIMVIICAIAGSQAAISIINWISTLIVRPDLLPRMDFSKGVPADHATITVIPALFNNLLQLEDLIEGLEIRFLANKDNNLYFALLTDFKDAKQEKLSGEEELLDLAKQKIEALNIKYANNGKDIFFIFHRHRVWNERDKIWMGNERKRGKLHDLNNLLRNKGQENFILISGDISALWSVQFVITLDADTQLPKDTARKIIGNLAHPLNRPFYDEKKGRVTEGYAILQPRVAASFPRSDSSFYKKIHSSDHGLDPYTKAISDVYQDLFHEGSFIGKGIYDVDIFEKALEDKMPENRILSHDLLEGSLARSALISDVQFLEEYPENYLDDVKRHSRWIRGDWQIATWLLPWAPGASKKTQKNTIDLLGKWKIADNLRRSIFPIAIMILFFFSLLHVSQTGLLLIIIPAVMIFPDTLSFLWEVVNKPEDIFLLHHIRLTIHFSLNKFYQHIFNLLLLPQTAFINIVSIFRVHWRVLISQKKLLQWNPASQSESSKYNIFETYISLWFEPFLAFGLLVCLFFIRSITIYSYTPLLALWLISPFICWYISKPPAIRSSLLSNEQILFLRKAARKTWAFFESFVGLEDNWLPPDNYQETPVKRIAHHTSPTNIGLSLLSNLAAVDFGYITALELLERTANTVTTMRSMERYKGHFFNWYDTRTLSPLNPRYVSTVDSGNLAGHLLVLKQALISFPSWELISPQLFQGMFDNANLLLELYPDSQDIRQLLEEVKSFGDSKPIAMATVKWSLEKILAQSEKINSSTDLSNASWLKCLIDQCKIVLEEIGKCAPWLSLGESPVKFQQIVQQISFIPSFSQLAEANDTISAQMSNFLIEENSDEENLWINQFEKLLADASRWAKDKIMVADALAQQCVFLSDMDYDFLYDKTQRLLSIGFHTDDQRRDAGFYDLLASESRLTFFVAIAQGKIPQESWFALGRQLTNPGTTPILLSWSGSMFEYLMPLLVMPAYENTLLDQTDRSSVKKQIEYGKKRNVPWGISESGYNMFDSSLNYQYKAFGVPGLGLKRGLGEELVIAPYASVMALMVSPREACHNLEVISQSGYTGSYGFYEAIDYTAMRLPPGQDHAVIRSFMSHHQGMSLLSLDYLLMNRPMQKRFEEEIHCKSVLLLLQERIPHATEFYSPSVHVSQSNMISHGDTQLRIIDTHDTPSPEVQLLSNGRYHVMISNSGGGYSRWKDLAVTRWREDVTCDNWGNFCYLRDLDTGKFWSSGYQPTLHKPENYEVVFSQGRADIRRKDFDIEIHTEIVVSAEDDVELRRIHITNRSRKRRHLEITSYAEIVLASAAADDAHQAFSKLFIQTEILKERNAIICNRRPGSDEDAHPWMFHLMKIKNTENPVISYETDRNKFIGRGKSIVDPQTMSKNESLSNTQGAVLDPIVSIRYKIILEPYQSLSADLVFGIGESKEACTSLVEKYQDRPMSDRAFELAWTHSQVVLRQINASEADAQLYVKLAASLIYANQNLRADPTTIKKNRRPQSGLWSHSVSGDLPIILLRIADQSNIEILKQIIQAHAYWHLKGLKVDLVIWNEDRGGYRQNLQNQILSLAMPGMNDVKDQPGGIFIKLIDQVPTEDRILFEAVARIIVSDSWGTLEEQINRRNRITIPTQGFSPQKFYPSVYTSLKEQTDLQFYNGIGGFSKSENEYVINCSPGVRTPAPWTNVLANPSFGTIISESGQCYTWFENAHEYRLTPWKNDPVCDTGGETFYLRDDESGKVWSPTPLPLPGKFIYTIRHGYGYSIFQYHEEGIESELQVYVDEHEAVKISLLKLINKSGRARNLSVLAYVEWVLGDLQSKNSMHVTTEVEPSSGAILAKNIFNIEFSNYVAFFDTDELNKTVTGDRTEFIGRNSSLTNPDAINKIKLSGRTGAGLDPCAAFHVVITLEEDEEKEVIFRLGAAKDVESAIALARKSKGQAFAQAARRNTTSFWKNTLNTIEIKTPDTALNLLTNGWLNYQTLASRIFGRTGFYQSGGAFGFRDQLQDVLSLLYTKPDLVRGQILLHASRQFVEGDVQHWWHPPFGKGVRTTCSDDFLWLPYAVCIYTHISGDKNILDEKIHFIEGRQLNKGEESSYDLPVKSDRTASLYEHCVLAIKRSFEFGIHGLPLMGSGDWNDGMDKVGINGQGESVWLGFFLFTILQKFSGIAMLYGDKEFAAQCIEKGKKLKGSLNKNTWDGKWFLRAFYDNGDPLGSNANLECKIDSLSQSWSVLSGAGDSEKSEMAMSSAYQHLVRNNLSLIQLFEPAFDKTDKNPGYIKGYVPGVRENGGQYTHGAVWLVMAFAQMKNKKRAWELLNMINPIQHGSSPNAMAIYQVEPYVMSADIYTERNHQGKGGWTWYTGSAGWMYTLIIEYFLGLKQNGNVLTIDPCIPEHWKTFSVAYKFGKAVYEIEVIQENGINGQKMIIDGNEQTTTVIQLQDDAKNHIVKVFLTIS
jgi:cyclic beta-1,2-glucan synthetase